MIKFHRVGQLQREKNSETKIFFIMTSVLQIKASTASWYMLLINKELLCVLGMVMQACRASALSPTTPET